MAPKNSKKAEKLSSKAASGFSYAKEALMSAPGFLLRDHDVYGTTVGGINLLFERPIGNAAMLLYRTAGLAFNVVAAAKGYDVGQFKFDKPTMELSSKFYNLLSWNAGIFGYDMGRYNAYDPEFLSPQNDETDKTYYYVKTAEQFSLDFLNNTGFHYDINLKSITDLESYLKERTKEIKSTKHKIQQKDSTIDLSKLSLDLNDDLKKAEQAIKDLQNELKEKKKKKFPINPSDYQDRFKTLSDDLENALKKQLKEDKERINEITSENPDITDLKENLEKALEFTEKKEKNPDKKEESVIQSRLEAFKKTIAKDAQSFQEAANHDMRRISFLNQVMKQDPKMRKTIEDLAKKAQNKRREMDGPATLEISLVSSEPLNLKDIDASVINSFRTNTGVTISKKTNEKGEEVKGSYTMQLPNRFSPLYYYGFKGEHNTKFDMTMLVKAMLANNPDCPSIMIDIKHPDPEHARFLALKAFEASRDEGLDESKIFIKINGKEVPLYDKMKTVEGKEQVETKGVLGQKDSASADKLKESIDTHAQAYQEAREQNFASMKSRAAALKAPAATPDPEAPTPPASPTSSV